MHEELPQRHVLRFKTHNLSTETVPAFDLTVLVIHNYFIQDLNMYDAQKWLIQTEWLKISFKRAYETQFNQSVFKALNLFKMLKMLN